jgi:hypothetical protein
LFYQGNILSPGKPHRQTTPAARAATDTKRKPSEDTPGTDAQLKGIIPHIWNGTPLNHGHTTFIRNKYKCIHCFSNTHVLEACRAISKRWGVTVLPPDPGGRSHSGQKAAANSNIEAVPPIVPSPAPIPSAPAPKAQVATHTSSTPGEEDASEADKSDETFTYYGYDSDPDLLPALTQQAARKTADQARVRFLDKPTTTIARMANNEVKWVDEQNMLQMLGKPKLATISTIYNDSAFVSLRPSIHISLHRLSRFRRY